jgi:hypothetical protein
VRLLLVVLVDQVQTPAMALLQVLLAVQEHLVTLILI